MHARRYAAPYRSPSAPATLRVGSLPPAYGGDLTSSATLQSANRLGPAACDVAAETAALLTRPGRAILGRDPSSCRRGQTELGRQVPAGRVPLPAVGAGHPTLGGRAHAGAAGRRGAGARRGAALGPRVCRPAAAGGARAGVASRGRANAAGGACGERRPAQGAQEPPAAADRDAPGTAARGPRGMAARARRPRRAALPVGRRRVLAGVGFGATGASGSTGRSPRPSGSMARGRTTCGTRSRRC
jgi:hypothetical protein